MIEKLAKEKELEEKRKSSIEPIKRASVDPIDSFIKGLNLVQRLSKPASLETMQIIIEEALLYFIYRKCCLEYSIKKDTPEGHFTVGELIKRLESLWENVTELIISETNLYNFLRRIWIFPYTVTENNYGAFERITKEKTENYNPFFYGPLSDEIYFNLVKDVREEEGGIKVIRRVIDHMWINNHIPSTELIEKIIEECIAAKWPRALITTIKFSTDRDVIPKLSTWVDLINFLRFSEGNFDNGIDMLTLCLSKKVPPEWELIQSYVKKYLSHNMVSNASSMVKRFIQETQLLNIPDEEKLKKRSALVEKYLKTLTNFGKNNSASAFVKEYINAELGSEDSIELAFKLFEETKSHEGVAFYRDLISNEDHQFTPRFISNALRMCTQLNEKGLLVVDHIRETINNDPSLATGFAVNMIIVSYSFNEKWMEMSEFLTEVINKKLPCNKFTKPTIMKLVETCLEQLTKKKIIEQANNIDS